LPAISTHGHLRILVLLSYFTVLRGEADYALLDFHSEQCKPKGLTPHNLLVGAVCKVFPSGLYHIYVFLRFVRLCRAHDTFHIPRCSQMESQLGTVNSTVYKFVCDVGTVNTPFPRAFHDFLHMLCICLCGRTLRRKCEGVFGHLEASTLKSWNCEGLLSNPLDRSNYVLTCYHTFAPSIT
jgi:hypothetical protein